LGRKVRGTVGPDQPLTLAIPHTCLADFLYPPFNGGLVGTAELVVECRAVNPEGPTSHPDRHASIAAQPANRLTHPSGLQSFRRMASCNISRSSVRSATIFLSRLFSSSSAFNWGISSGNNPTYFARRVNDPLDHSLILLNPVEVRRLTDTGLAADLRNRNTAIVLFQNDVSEGAVVSRVSMRK
jgi:hypothetical protein